MIGTAGFTVIVILAMEVPVILVADTWYNVAANIAVGVPLIVPVDVLMLSPAGSAGDIPYDVTGPPVFVGLIGVMAVPARYTSAGAG